MTYLNLPFSIINTSRHVRRTINTRNNVITNQRLRLHHRTHHQWSAIHPLPPSLLRLLVSSHFHTYSTPTANHLGLVHSWRPCNHILRPRYATAVLGNGELRCSDVLHWLVVHVSPVVEEAGTVINIDGKSLESELESYKILITPIVGISNVTMRSHLLVQQIRRNF